MPFVAQGGSVTLRAEVRNGVGSLTDGSSIALTIKDPSAAVVAGFPVGVPPISHDGVGLYSYVWTVGGAATLGSYTAIWSGIVAGDDVTGQETVEVVPPGSIGTSDARPSMLALITRLRRLVGDVSSSPTFTDLELQDSLDERRTDVVEAALRYRLSFHDSSTVVARDFFAPRRWWEDSVELFDVTGGPLTPDSADLMTGHWGFDAGHSIPIYISGSFYDLYGTAQQVCEQWAALVAREFDFETDQQSFDRSNKREGLLAVAREYARKAIPPGRRPAWRSSEW